MCARSDVKNIRHRRIENRENKNCQAQNRHNIAAEKQRQSKATQRQKGEIEAAHVTPHASQRQANSARRRLPTTNIGVPQKCTNANSAIKRAPLGAPREPQSRSLTLDNQDLFLVLACGAARAAKTARAAANDDQVKHLASTHSSNLNSILNFVCVLCIARVRLAVHLRVFRELRTPSGFDFEILEWNL